MADAQVKPEIKVDPATAAPTGMADVEGFEDDTDLYIPPLPAADGSGTQAWLVKVPKYMWEAWAELYRSAPDDGGYVEIGKMLVYNRGQPGKERTQIRLTPNVPQHVDLPKIYNLDIKATGYSNTVVFSEKDQPGHSSSRPQPFSRSSRPRGIPSKHERYGNNTKPGKYRTAIPKQTALAPLIWHVADANPEQDASYYAHFAKTYNAQIKPKKTTTYFAGIDRTLTPSASHLNTFPSFGISSRPGGKNKKAAPKEKNVRMPQDQLLDAMYHLYTEYTYWPLKSMRVRLRQPEAYVKETLEGVATLIRSGQYSMNYGLKPEYAAIVESLKAAGGGQGSGLQGDVAPMKSDVEESEMEMDGGLGSGDDDSPDEEFEDVV